MGYILPSTLEASSASSLICRAAAAGAGGEGRVRLDTDLLAGVGSVTTAPTVFAWAP